MTHVERVVDDAVASERELVVALVAQLLRTHPPQHTDPVDFLGAQFDLGLAWVHFDLGSGGLGVSPGLQQVVDDALSAAGAPDAHERNPIGHGMGAPTVHEWGDAGQRERLLRPLFTGEEIWCQLFSEPGAGSDVAGLATQALRDGDVWIVSGQKVWTTLGHVARRGLLVARTDPVADKHHGLTYFVLDMRAAGVEVRPLRQMTGDQVFNSVHLSDVRVDDGDRLGPVGDGWRVVVTTLMNERVSHGSIIEEPGTGPIADAVRLVGRAGGDGRPARDRLMQRWSQAELNRLTNLRAAARRTVGDPGPEGSIGKLLTAESYQRIQELCIDALGVEGMLYSDYEPADTYLFSDDVQRNFLRSRATSIEGGTSEVMRNIIGERLLGLPGDVRVDKGVPWSSVPRN